MIYGLSYAWHRIRDLENKLKSSQIDEFQLASEIRHELLKLNTTMLHYALVRNPQEWTQFEEDSSQLDHWIDDHDPSLNPHTALTTDAERQVFKDLNNAYDDYLAAARAVHTNAVPAIVDPRQLRQLDAFNAQAMRMRDYVRKLSDAHRDAEKIFLANANESLASLKKILIGSVVLLLVLVGVMGWVIYRDKIAPLQVKLVQSQNLLERQQKLATLGTLAAGIAHEIRNPLTSLKARLYTLEKHLHTLPAAKKDTDIISAEISRLEHIVRDVLSFARPSDPKLETLASEAVLRELYGLMSPDLESRSLKLVVEAHPDLYICADSGQLKQVLINLVRNAAEAIDGIGTVTLRSRAAKTRLGGRETQVVILEVSDTGKGIPAETEKRLFDPFYSTKETGTGLGLSIAERIIEKHGGMLQYQTRPGYGTTFGVVLPRKIHDTAPNANHNENVPLGSGQPGA